ncbi:rhombosortase [Candidatus Reidiella endopervernicosa]|nr:rhombosortase [Candidatus Reidiella endopervernicosa]
MIALIGESAVELLRYDRGAILAGEWWRLISGHWVHLNIMHLLLNLAGLLLVAILFDRALPIRSWLLLVLLSAPLVSIALLQFDRELIHYVGLSGLLHGLFVAGALVSIGRMRVESMGLLLAIAAKLAWEQFNGATPGTAELVGGRVIVNAHLYGAISGLLLIGLLRRQTR